MRSLCHCAAQHAQTRNANVTLTGSRGAMHLVIADEGVGFDAEAAKAKARLGLISIQERVRQAGGTFSLDSRPGMGTRIDVCVPLDEPHPAVADGLAENNGHRH